MENFYTISKKIDSAKFFKFMGVYFKDATTLFIEGNSIAEEVLKNYKANLQEGEYLPSIGTIFPKSQKFRCSYSSEFMNQLSSIAEHQAEPELLDHFHLYKRDEPIIVWKDAFFDTMYISKKIPQEIVNKFLSEIKAD